MSIVQLFFFCGKSIECFTGIVYRYVSSSLVTIRVAPVINPSNFMALGLSLKVYIYPQPFRKLNHFNDTPSIIQVSKYPDLYHMLS
jgi:hypothetical protein